MSLSLPLKGPRKGEGAIEGDSRLHYHEHGLERAGEPYEFKIYSTQLLSMF